MTPLAFGLWMFVAGMLLVIGLVMIAVGALKGAPKFSPDDRHLVDGPVTAAGAVLTLAGLVFGAWLLCAGGVAACS